MRDARLHIRHVRDLLRSLDPSDAYNGVNCSSLSYLHFYTRGEKGNAPSLFCRFCRSSFALFTYLPFSDRDSLGNRGALEKESAEFRPPEYLLPGCKDRPLAPLQPVRDDRKVRRSVLYMQSFFITKHSMEHVFSSSEAVSVSLQPVQCLRVLTMNGWNPPPGNRKMHGDLMYLNVVTMEDKELNLTSATRGFYLNQ